MRRRSYPLPPEEGRPTRPGFADVPLPKRYRILESISSSGMARVVKVFDRESGQVRAVKLLRLSETSPTELELFRLEFARISALDHPHIIRVHEFGTLDQRSVYFVMDFLGAEHFDRALAGKPTEKLAAVCLQMCEALSYVHRRGIVHGDIKPSNILIEGKVEPGSDKTDTLSAKIMDFGLARMMLDAGVAGGTHAYVAPEVIRGLPIDGRTDLYSLGAMLYEVLTGSKIFPGASGEHLLRAHLLSRPVSPRELNPSVPVWMQSLVLKLLEKDPGRRYRSADELACAIKDVVGLGQELTITDAIPVTLLSPQIVGREQEFDVLRESLRVLKDKRRGGFLMVCGDLGSGKSRLMEWLRFIASAEGERVGLVKCGELEPDSMSTLLKWSGRVLETGPVSHAADESRAHSAIESSAGGATEMACGEEGLFLLGSIYPSHSRLPDPCVVIFEDIHLGSSALLRALTGSVSLTRVFPLLVVCSCEARALDVESETGRLFSRLASDPRASRIDLGPLSGADILRLVSSMLGLNVTEQVERLAEWVHSASRGVVGVAEELVRQLSLRGHLKKLGERLVCELPSETDVLSSLSVPETLRHQIKNLSPSEFGFLSAAAVSGNVFNIDAVAEVLRDTPVRIASTVESLRERGLIRPVGAIRYEFTHAVTRSLVCNLMSDEVRTDLHARTALLLEKHGTEEDAARLATHYEGSGQEDKAYEARLDALEFARKRGKHADALLHAETLLPRLRESGPPDVLSRLLGKAADSAQGLGKYVRAIQLYEEQFTLMATEGPEERAGVCFKIGELYIKRSCYREAQERLTYAAQTLSGSDNKKLRAEVLAAIGWTLFGLSRHGEALAALEEASNLLSGETAASDTMALIANRVGVVLSRVGRLEESEKSHRKAVQLAESGHDPGTLGTCLNNLGLVLLKTGRLEEAELAMSRACRMASSTADVGLLSICYNNLGVVRKELLKLDGALDSYLRSMELSKRCGHFAGSGRTALNVAVLYRLKGEIGLAFRYYEESYRIASEFGVEEWTSPSVMNMGEIEGMRGNLQEAEKYYLEALAARERAGDPDGVALCATGLGYAFLRSGEVEKALSWARRALETATDGSREKVSARLLLAEVLCLGGRAEDAAREVEALEQCEKDMTPTSLGIERRVRGIVLEKSGRLAEAVESFRSSCSVLGDAADALERARSLFFLGRGLLAYAGVTGPGDAKYSRQELLREAVSVLEEACEVFERMEAAPERSSCLSVLAGAYRELTSLLGRGSTPGEAEAFFMAAGLVNSTLPLSVVLERIMDMAIEKTRAERGLLALVDQETGSVEKVLSRALEGQTEQDAFEISRTVVKRVTQGGYPLLTQDAAGDPELRSVKSVVRLEIRSVLCVPLKARNRVIGAVYLDNRSLPGAFGPAEQSFMEGFADLAGMAIEGARLREQLERRGELLSRENIELRKHVASQYRFDQIIGESPEMKRVFGAMEKVARSNATVLIVGESGTGKELVARAIHSNSTRKDKPFVPVNCAAIPRDLIEGELFGIEDRVATGVSKRSGYFEQADGGTIFLDEIGDMSLELQSKLLRVLQEREFKRIGGRHNIAADVRIICATNKNLFEEIARGSFRADLYYRISGIPVEIPPLRERRGDIPRLVDFFLNKYGAINKVDRPPRISAQLMKVLIEADWEGNVRELENCIERFVVMCPPGEEVRLSMLPERLKSPSYSAPTSPGPARRKLKDEMAELEKDKLTQALIRNKGNRSKTARELGVSEQSVRYKIRKYRLNIRQLCRDALTQ